MKGENNFRGSGAKVEATPEEIQKSFGRSKNGRVCGWLIIVAIVALLMSEILQIILTWFPDMPLIYAALVCFIGIIPVWLLAIYFSRLDNQA
jgi:uncharacterized membrane protein